MQRKLIKVMDFFTKRQKDSECERDFIIPRNICAIDMEV